MAGAASHQKTRKIPQALLPRTLKPQPIRETAASNQRGYTTNTFLSKPQGQVNNQQRKDFLTQYPVPALPEMDLCSKSCKEVFHTSAHAFGWDQKDRLCLQNFSHHSLYLLYLQFSPDSILYPTRHTERCPSEGIINTEDSVERSIHIPLLLPSTASCDWKNNASGTSPLINN